MPNARVYYPIHAVGFGPLGASLSTSGQFIPAKGVQSVSVNTSFSLEQVYQLGQLSLYENIENLPNVEMTVEKVNDGYALIQHLGTPNATVSTLAGRYNDNRCNAVIAYYPITNSFATGNPLVALFMSGLYVSSLNWNLPVEGNQTESVTFVGNDKTWFNAVSGAPFSSGNPFHLFTGSDSPVTASGGVQRRENIVMASSYWPTDIPGVSGNGINPLAANGFYTAHLQDISISVQLGRTDLFEQGSKAPYFRYANFPVEVSTTINVTASESGDNKNVVGNSDNLTDQRIFVVTSNGTRIDLGTRNKLQSITQNGGDTGGGNVTVSYTYSNFNDYTVWGPRDPAGIIWPN